MSGELLIRCIITGWVTITDQGLIYTVLLARYKTGEVMVPCAVVNTGLVALLGKGTNRTALCTFYYSLASLHVCKVTIRYCLLSLRTEC